ncbi:MAG: TlpA disulfide reductase family protein [Desulfobaccales bacterium]
MTDPSEPLRFSFPNLAGQTVSNTDAKFRGKVVLVNITGSWCPNCHDEAPFLEEMYKKYRSLGLVLNPPLQGGHLGPPLHKTRQSTPHPSPLPHWGRGRIPDLGRPFRSRDSVFSPPETGLKAVKKGKGREDPALSVWPQRLK